MVHDVEGIDGSALAQAYARARGADRMSRYAGLERKYIPLMKDLVSVILLRCHGK